MYRVKTLKIYFGQNERKGLEFFLKFFSKIDFLPFFWRKCNQISLILGLIYAN